MWKKVFLLMAVSASLCANEQAEYNEGLQHLRFARQACKDIQSQAYKARVGNSIDSAIQILNDTGFNPHAAQVANAVFYDCCNSMLSIPDDATFKMLEEISSAEDMFKKSLFTRMEQDRRLGK